MDQRERTARELEAKRRRFVRGLQADLIACGDPPEAVRALPMLALLARHTQVWQRMQTTTPGEERCLD